jgi:hypothetical protein
MIYMIEMTIHAIFTLTYCKGVKIGKGTTRDSDDSLLIRNACKLR